MSKILELQNKRAELASQMRTLVDNMDSEKGATPEQDAEFKNMQDAIESLDKQIRREQSVRDIEASIGSYEPVPRGSPDNVEDVRPNSTQEYLKDFLAFIRRPELSADARSNLSKVSNAMTIGTDSEGGFIVPEAWETTLINALSQVVLMRQLATVRSTTSTRNLPIVDDRGQAGWVDELGSYPESDIAFANMQLLAWKLGRIIRVSEELLEDSFLPIESEISQIFAEVFGEAEDLAFFTADGVSKPRGIILDSDVGVTAASNSALTYDEIVTLVYSVKERFRNNATMTMADGTAGLLRRLKSTDGVPLWQPSMQAGQPDLMLGRPVRTTDSMPGVGASASPILFGDFKYYRIADRGSIFMQRLNEKYADVGAVGFRMRKRVDGKLTRSEAVKRLTMPA